MQYNAELIKKILFTIEARIYGLDSLPIDYLCKLLPMYTPGEISDHVLLLQTQNCLDVQRTYLNGCVVDTVISRTTLDGKKLSIAAADTRRWEGFLKTAKADGAFINHTGFSDALLSVLYSPPL